MVKHKESSTFLAFISIFFGGIGLHKAYLGKNLTFVMYFMFCWTLIPSVLCVVDAVKLMSMSDREFNLLYNYEYMDELESKYNKADSLLNAPSHQIARKQSSISKTQELRELRQLLVEGAIDESDYEQMKKEILRR